VSIFKKKQNFVPTISQDSILGKFTDGAGITVTGDAADLELKPKEDGTFIDKNGKVYDYSRATSRELRDAGVKLQSPKDALSAHVKNQLDLKALTDAVDYLLEHSEEVGLSKKATKDKQYSVILKGHEFFTDKQTKESLEKAGLTHNQIVDLIEKSKDIPQIRV
jgi:hypothetical protein